jgi:hypothetical protein
MNSINTSFRVSCLWGVIIGSGGCLTECFHSSGCCGFQGRGFAPALETVGRLPSKGSLMLQPMLQLELLKYFCFTIED